MSDQYNKQSVFQAGVVAYITKLKIPHVLKSFDREQLLSEKPFVVADYGTAGGANSFPLFDAIIMHVHEVNPHKRIMFYLEDIPENNFTITFKAFEEKYKANPLVFCFGIGRSFFEQVLPPNMVDIGFSFNAVHWISRFPGKLEGYLQGGPFIEDSESRTAWLG